jgi:hypothetical protein
MRTILLWLSLALGLPLSALAQQCTQNQLNTEFTTDPTGRTYVTCAADGNLAGNQVNDECVLTKFNAPCADAACKVDQSVSREVFWSIIDNGELTTLLRSTAPNDVARVRALDFAMANTSLDLGKGSVRQKLNDIFPGASSPITNAAIAALQQKNVPRSQIVCQRAANTHDVSCGLRGVGCR